MRRTFKRTPQACDHCRRRKNKCDGARPRCRRCAAKNVPCVWSFPGGSDDGQPDRFRSVTSDPAVEIESSPGRMEGLKLCLDLFFDHHFASDFCSFDHRADFEDKCTKDPLLYYAIIALCGRYLSDQDAHGLYGFPSGGEVSLHYLHKVRPVAKASVDEPSTSNIQGILILAHAELLSNSGCRHWLFAGAAIRMAEVMRLNKPFHQRHSLKEQEARRRIFWACLVLDRMLAFLLAKHRTIDVENISIPVPGSDLSLAYNEDTRGATLDSLLTYPRPSDLGLNAYLIKTICLWSDLADFTIYSRRRLDTFAPTDARSAIYIRYSALSSWVESLQPGLRWNMTNFKIQVDLGYAKPFVAMHFLLNSAACVAHQCYLPQLAMYTKLFDLVDAAGWSYLHREQSLVEICVSHALKAGEMLACLLESGHERARSSLQTVWVASSCLVVANTLLWLEFAQDEAFSDEDTQQRAKAYWQMILDLVSSWTPQWKAAKQWLGALNLMRSLYRAAYLGEVAEPLRSPSSAADEPAGQDDDSANDFRPQPGDGYPTLISMPSLHASVKFATGDTSARSIDLQSIWNQLSGGWPHGFAEHEGASGSVMGVQFDGDIFDCFARAAAVPS